MTESFFAPCRKLPFVLLMAGGAAFAGPMHGDADDAVVLAAPTVQATAQVAAPVDRFGGVRASINDFAHADGSQVTRRSLSDDERREMRRQIDEAISKAYPRRHAQD